MRNTFLIFKHEVLTIIRKPSFWLMTFLFPAIVLLLSIGMQMFGTKAIEDAEEAYKEIDQTVQSLPIGYIDEAGIIEAIPEWVPDNYLISYPDQALAHEAIITGNIKQYYLIPSEFLIDGQIVMVDRNFQPMKSSGNAEIFETIIIDILIDQDPVGKILQDPTFNLKSHSLAPSTELVENKSFSFTIPMATLFIFFFIITTSSSFMLTSVTKEKENHTAETLLVSVNPHQLMVGKIIGLGIIALFQMSIWLGGSLIVLDTGPQFFMTAADLELTRGFIVWSIAFFITGYFLYAAILGSIGVLAPNAREGGQFTFIAIFPLIIPLWFNYSFSETPNGPIPLILSLFPLTAPSSMITRMTSANVPTWQLLLSLSGLILTAYLFIMLASRLFRADNMLSAESFKWKRLIAGFRKQPK